MHIESFGFVASAAMLLVGVPVVTASAEVPETTTYVTLGGHDYVALEESRLWRDGAGSISASGSLDDGVSVFVDGGPSGDAFTIRFAAPPGESLAEGEYLDAETTPFRTEGHPGLDVFGDGRGCDTVSGRFVVHHIAPDVSSFWVSYEAPCDPSLGATFGEIKYHMPAADPEVLVAPTRVDWPTAGATLPGTSSPVTLVNTGTEPLTVSSASITAGNEAFAVSGNTCAQVAVGSTCAIKVKFSPKTVGTFAGMLTIGDSTTVGTRLVPLTGRSRPTPVRATLKTDRSMYDYGQTAKVTATLSGTYATPAVRLYARVGNGAQTLVATRDVDSGGRVTIPVRLTQNTVFRLKWTDGTASTAAPDIKANVRAGVSAAMVGFRKRSGFYYLFTPGKKMLVRATTMPVKPGKCMNVRAEHYRSGSWRFYAETGCVRMGAQGVVIAYLPYAKALLRRPFRFRSNYNTDTVNYGAASEWKYAKWVR